MKIRFAIFLLFNLAIRNLALLIVPVPNDIEYSFIDSQYNRILEKIDYSNALDDTNSNCQIYDKISTISCLKCVDKFMLPDCQSCPVGYKKINNACVQCGPNQLFCGSTDSSEYCYIGFTKKGNDCVCDSPKQIMRQWCTNPTDLIYQVTYQDGEIIAEFSNQIEGGVRSSAFIPQYSNCYYLENYETDIQEQISCFINQNDPNKFQIIIKNNPLSQRTYHRIPQFYQNLLQIIDGDILIDSTSITFQPLYQKGALQQAYFYANDFTEKLCYFKDPIYYFQTDQQNFYVNYDNFVHKKDYFQDAGPNYSVIDKSKNIQQSDLQLMINQLDLLYSFKQIPLPQSLFSIEETFVVFSFECLYPYDLISTNTVTFWSKRDLTPVCTNSLLNSLPLMNSDQITIRINCSFLYFIGDPETTIQIQYKVVDSSSYQQSENRILDLKVDIKLKDFPYDINIDPYTFDYNKQYSLYITPIYSEYYGNIFNQNLVIKKKPIQVTISGGNLAYHNPTDLLILEGNIEYPSIRDISNSSKVYIWTCFDQILKINCQDAWQNPRQYPQTNQFIINPMDFDFGGTYIITLQGIYSGTGEQQTVNITYKTVPSATNLTAIYDQSYNNNVQIDQKLSFFLQYNNSEFLISSNLNLSYIIVTQNQKFYESPDQRESAVYFAIGEKIQNLYYEQNSINFYVKFFGKGDNNYNITSKNYYFKTSKPPYGCDIQLGDTQNKIAFVDLIKISIINCKSDTNSELLYQFMYYNKPELEVLEMEYPDDYKRKYLTEFSRVNTIETYLPPGNIKFIVVIKDKYESKIRQSESIKILKNTFTQNQFDDFMNNQFKIANQFKTNNKFEKQLCTYGIMADCIEDFEKTNNQIDPTPSNVKLKDNMKEEMVILPQLVPNDLNSSSLQEFNMRNLVSLYDSKNGPDQFNLMTRLRKVNDLVQERVDNISKLKPFFNEIKDTYRRTFLITFDVTAETIIELSKSTQESVSWSDHQVKNVFLILNGLSITAHVNDQTIKRKSPTVDISVQKVDQKTLFENYLYYEKEEYDFKQLDTSIIYDVQIQNWKENIYSFEQGYKDMFQPYISKAKTQEMIDILQKEYPAVYPKITRNIGDQRFLQGQDQVTVPSKINIQFQNLQGNQKVKCTQRIQKVWTKSSCQTITIQDNPKFNVICACSTPNYTSLVADVEALFENENLNNIFSEQGFSSIFSQSNWYKFSCIYVIIIINILLIATAIVGVKLDKTDKVTGRQTTGSTLTALASDTQIKKNKRKQRPSIHDKITEEEIRIQIENKYRINEEKAQIEIPSSQNTPNNNNDNFYTNQGYNSGSSAMIMQNNQLVNKNTNRTTQATIQESSQQGSKGIFGGKNTQEHPLKLLQSEPLIKLQGDTNVQIYFEDENINKKDFKYTPNVHNKNGRNHEQQAYLTNENLKQQDIAKIMLNTEDKITNTPEISKKEMKRREEIEKQKLIRQLSYVYLSGLSLFKGTCVFHDLLQIFIIYDKKQSRFYRFSLFYNQIIWLLTLNAIFGENLTIVQVCALSLVSSLIFGLFKIIYKFTLTKKPLKIIGFFLLLGFLFFCYYSILVVMANSQPSASNGWIVNYIIALVCDIFIFSFISSAIKYYATLKLLSVCRVNHLIFKFTGADSIFRTFK